MNTDKGRLASTIKILNLYAGIGGNRKLWKNVEVIAIEKNSDIANIYRQLFPNDVVIETDAFQYLKDHHNEFDFIWSSPPCQTHSKMRNSQRNTENHEEKEVDMSLYQVILFCKQYVKCKWIVENVKPWYESEIEDYYLGHFIKPTIEFNHHTFWTNFPLIPKEIKKYGKNIALKTFDDLIDYLGYHDDFDLLQQIRKFNPKHPDQILRNCVHPIIGKHILNQAVNQQTVEAYF